MESLRPPSRRLVENARDGDPMPSFTLVDDIVSQLSQPIDIFILSSVVADGTPSHDRQDHEFIVWAEACLRNPHGIQRSESTADATALLSWLLETLRPPAVLFGWRSAFDRDPQNEVSQEDVHRFCLMAVAGIRAISSLTRLVPELVQDHANDLLATAATFSENGDPWTRQESFAAADGLLSQLCKASIGFSSVVPSILQEVVRPAFSRQKQPAITTGGRRAINPATIPVHFSQIPEAEEKPWKFTMPWVTTVFLWCVKQIEASQLNGLWPQVTPPTLALLDDGAVPFKTHGCQVLRAVLARSDGPMLQRTGLGDVFEQALLAALVLLPSLTEEQESLLVLSHAYPSLRQLANVRYSAQSEQAARVKCLDKVLRTGVIRGFTYAGEYPRIGTLLTKEMAYLVKEEGIDAVKHLKNIVPILVDNLCNPFITASPGLISATAETLQTVLLTCWPRINRFAGDILKGITVCWCRIADEAVKEGFLEAKAALKTVLTLLKATLSTDSTALKDVQVVLQSDERLTELVNT